MGKITPRRRKRLPFYHPVVKMWMTNRNPFVRDVQQEEAPMPEGISSHIKAIPGKIWHLPDSIRWMDPLPYTHRRGIILALIVILLAFLWPSPAPRAPVSPPVLQSGANNVPLQAELNNNRPSPGDTVETRPQDNASSPAQGEWRSYQIAAGQTLAQLFRDNNLQVNDVFAMARVEGDDKPLSNLHAGQNVKVRQDAQGMVNGLTIETDNGEILFTRQTDGSFIRAQ
nr:LysM-like peptidoglycan-binding domain-containing protein [Pantoea sp. 201603H]